MKKLLIGFVAVVITVACASAGDIGVFGSRWNTEDGDDTYGGGISYLAEFAPLEFRGTYYDKIDLGDGLGGGRDVEAIPIDGGLAFNLTRAEIVDLYIGAGASYYILDSDERAVDNEWGWYAMARLEVPLETNYSIFGEVMHRGLTADDLDATLDGTVFNVGIVFR